MHFRALVRPTEGIQLPAIAAPIFLLNAYTFHFLNGIFMRPALRLRREYLFLLKIRAKKTPVCTGAFCLNQFVVTGSKLCYSLFYQCCGFAEFYCTLYFETAFVDEFLCFGGVGAL